MPQMGKKERKIINVQQVFFLQVPAEMGESDVPPVNLY
jgi:hypothetical protein